MWLAGGLTNVMDQGAKTSHWWRRPKTFVVVPTPPVATGWRNNHLHKIRLMQQIWTNIEGYGIRMEGGIGAGMCIVVQLKRGDILCILQICDAAITKGMACCVSLNIISENWWKLLISAFLSFSNALVLIHQHLNKPIQDTTYYWVTTITIVQSP